MNLGRERGVAERATDSMGLHMYRVQQHVVYVYVLLSAGIFARARVCQCFQRPCLTEALTLSNVKKTYHNPLVTSNGSLPISTPFCISPVLSISDLGNVARALERGRVWND